LDAFKGFCLALVICIHLKCKGGLWLAPWANPFKLAGFFVVSGYLLSLKPGIGPVDAAKMLARRWRGIMLPYFTFSVLAVAVLVPWHARTLAGATSLANDMIAKTALLRGYSTLWFLPVLFLAETFFLGTLALENCVHRRAGRGAWLVHPLAVVLAIGLSLCLSPVAQPLIRVRPNQQLVANILLPWLRALPAFACVAAGYFAYGKLLSACSRHAGLLAGTSAAFLLAGFAAGRMLGNVNWNNNVYGGNLCLFVFSGIASSFGLMLGFKLLSRFLSMPVLRFIGVNSLVLMATHLPLPIVKFAKDAAAWVAGCLPAFGGFLAHHPLVDCLWRLAIVLLLEVPIVLLFMHTPLKVLLGKPASRSRPASGTKEEDSRSRSAGTPA
jgi:hypothetical protein